MKALKTVLLIAGIALLLAGTWVQDVWVSVRACTAPKEVSTTRGGPSWSHMHETVIVPLHHQLQTGMILKLAGLGILFLLLFAGLHRAGRLGKDTTRPTLLALGSGLCLGAFAVLAPFTRSVEWAVQIFSTSYPDNLDNEACQLLRDAVSSNGYWASGSSLLLAVGLFLLGSVFFRYRIKAGTLSLFPVVLQPQVVRRVAISKPSAPVWSSSVMFFTGAFVIVSVAVFARALAARREEPRKVPHLAGILFWLAGGMAVLFWAACLFNISALSGLPHWPVLPSPTPAWQVLDTVLTSSHFVPIGLLSACVLLPIAGALSLRMPQGEKTGRARRSWLPLAAAGVLLACFALGGWLGAREDRRMASLRKISVSTDLFENVPEDAGRIESEEGLKFLREILNDPREFYWHRFILLHLLCESRNPKAREMFLEVLCDREHPVAAAQALAIVSSDMERGDSPGRQVGDMLSEHLERVPRAGVKIIEAMLGGTEIRSKHVFRVFRICAKKGVNEFPISEILTGWMLPDGKLDFPPGFTVHYNRKLGPANNKFAMKLLWCEPDSSRQTRHSNYGRTLLEVEGVEFPCFTSEFNAVLPDYRKLAEALKKAKAKSENVWVEIEAGTLTHAYHIGYVLEACAKAGVTEVSISEP